MGTSDAQIDPSRNRLIGQACAGAKGASAASDLNIGLPCLTTVSENTRWTSVSTANLAVQSAIIPATVGLMLAGCGVRRQELK